MLSKVEITVYCEDTDSSIRVPGTTLEYTPSTTLLKVRCGKLPKSLPRCFLLAVSQVSSPLKSFLAYFPLAFLYPSKVCQAHSLPNQNHQCDQPLPRYPRSLNFGSALEWTAADFKGRKSVLRNTYHADTRMASIPSFLPLA